MQVSTFVAIMQLEVSAAFMQLKFFSANMWVKIFIEIMQVGVSVVIMLVVYSAVHYAHDYFYCNYTGGRFCCSYLCEFQVATLYSFFQLTLTFHKIGKETFKGIMSSLHFTTFVNILPKLRYFVGRNHIQAGKIVIQYFCFPDRLIRDGGILDF